MGPPPASGGGAERSEAEGVTETGGGFDGLGVFFSDRKASDPTRAAHRVGDPPPPFGVLPPLRGGRRRDEARRRGWVLPGGDHLWTSPLGHQYTKSGKPP